MTYSCIDCQHRTKHGDKLFCTLNPAWVEIAPSHFCSQFNSEWNDDTPIAQKLRLAEERRDIYGEMVRENRRAIDAEKKLKVARRELREVRSRLIHDKGSIRS